MVFEHKPIFPGNRHRFAERLLISFLKHAEIETVQFLIFRQVCAHRSFYNAYQWLQMKGSLEGCWETLMCGHLGRLVTFGSVSLQIKLLAIFKTSRPFTGLLKRSCFYFPALHDHFRSLLPTTDTSFMIFPSLCVHSFTTLLQLSTNILGISTVEMTLDLEASCCSELIHSLLPVSIFSFSKL